MGDQVFKLNKCSVPKCARKQNLPYHYLPKDKKLYNKWIKNLNLNKYYVNKSFRVCSDHFTVNEYFPKKTETSKLILKRNAVPTKNLPSKKINSENKNIKERNFRLTESNHGMNKENEILVSEDETSEKEDFFISNETISKSFKNACTQVNTADLIPPIEYKNICLQVNTLENFKFTKILFYDSITTVNLLRSWTGINNFDTFDKIEKCVYNLEDIEEHLKQFQIPVKELIVLVLVKLKVNLTFAQMTVMFHLTPVTISKYFKEFLPMLKASIESVLYWPTKEENSMNIPKCFKPDFINCRAIFDCTEMELEKPKTLRGRIQTYSNYKGRYTIKVQIGVNPAGLIIHASAAYGGKVSDKHIFLEENLLEKFEEGDAIMVDKGYAILKECTEKGIQLIRPPFLNLPQHSAEDSLLNTSIASARVHVERAIQRIKLFKIFHDKITSSMAKQIDDIILVACCIVNLSPPILAADKF